MKAQVGFLQEKLADGTLSDSNVRLFSCFFFAFLCIYTFVSLHSYEDQFAIYVSLLERGCLTEQSFNLLVMQLKKIDWDIFLILTVATVAPKVIQKFAETKLGGKDTSETSVTKTEITKSTTTP